MEDWLNVKVPNVDATNADGESSEDRLNSNRESGRSLGFWVLIRIPIVTFYPTTPTGPLSNTMAPPGSSKRPHIVRSGNAGNSSKSTPLGTGPTAAGSQPSENRPPPLFPLGFKTPVKLLQERCQHNGWEKPSIEHKRSSQGFTAIVFLRNKDKKDASIVHSFRMEPRPPLDQPTAEQAKHWAATVPPPGPKEYWAELEKEKKIAPRHRAWEYETDPFTTAEDVKKRQKARETQSSKSTDQSTSSASAVTAEIEARVKSSKLWSHCPEVKMEIDMHDQTEHSSSHGKLEFVKMGFRTGHVVDALSHLSKLRGSQPTGSGSKLVATLMQTFLGGTDHDLPIRFRPTHNSTAFVTGTSRPVIGSSDPSDLRKTWILKRLKKLYGFPNRAAKQALHGLGKVSEGTALEVLSRILIGWEIDTVQKQVYYIDSCQDNDEVLRQRDERWTNEREALLSIFGEEMFQSVPEAEDTDFDIILSTPGPRTKDDLRLRISYHPHSLYPSPMSLLSTKSWNTMLEFGDGGVIFEILNLLEENWHQVVKNLPDVADVMFNFVVSKKEPEVISTHTISKPKAQTPGPMKSPVKAKVLQPDTALNRELVDLQQMMRSKNAYVSHLLLSGK
ncbi:hypothetical protein CROQUDRAFT_94846 [Cronartium quercuum f. sp. fusiforme G11]|uniref:ATP-dependent RNA helicase DHX29 DSRM-like domain-containing protein n=1 Tax=Cronartium quercuum f. sp. fusiforme G11 TaxID=708437 RepID=A0A9P6NIC9_9BASI|nr:hypothetical protein CROQUDRAFT_94846 [Cronartium quercuum f. sp. fusiforme G11]